MAIEIKVPRLGWSMEEGTFIEWFKRDGEPVRSGEPLFALEGDKAIQDIEAIGSGILRISPTAPENGEIVKVGTTLAFLCDQEESNPFHISATTDSGRAASTDSPIDAKPFAPVAVAERVATVEHMATQDQGKNDREPRISPRAARVATELGIEWKQISGTGRNGRIRERDVRNEASRNKAHVRRDSMTTGPSFRRTIAARMSEGAHATAPVTLTTTADATNLVSLRAQFKAAQKSPEERIPSYTDIVAKLAARALGQHPELNQQWVDGEIVTPDEIHIAIAVDAPAGLVAPVIRDVPALGLRQIAARTSDLQNRARVSQLIPDDLRGGTFTISNLGAFGIDAFTPIINVPQCAILGMGRIDRRPAVVGEQIIPRDLLTLSLTFDHRIVDGAPAARFLATLRSAIENPGPWLVF